MNGVIGMTDLLSETNLSAEQRDYVSTMKISGESLLAIINDVLDFSKIESGKMTLDIHAFQLRSCIEDLIEIFAPKVRAKSNLDLLYHISDNVPAFIESDVIRMRQILIHLISNAIKFTKEGYVFLQIAAGQSEKDPNSQTLSISVEDTGIGISEENQQNLFHAFTQADNSNSRKYGGAGLGLAISSRLIHMLGGKLRLRSEEGNGSTFFFDIDVKVPSEIKNKRQEKKEDFSGKKVRILDVNSLRSSILQRNCSQLGIKTEIYTIPQSKIPKDQYQETVYIATAETEAQFEEIQNRFELINSELFPRLLILSKRKSFDHQTSYPYIQVQLPYKLSELNSSLQKAFVLHPTPELATPLSTKPTPSPITSSAKPEEKPSIKPPLPKSKSAKPVDPKDLLASKYPMQILVTEDNLVNQKLVIRMLKKMGYSPLVANHGQEAVEQLEKHKVDLILMDLQMPVLDGLSATKKIRKELPGQQNPRIVAMTANAMIGDREKCISVGMDDYMSKPFKLATLKDMLIKYAPSDVKED